MLNAAASVFRTLEFLIKNSKLCTFDSHFVFHNFMLYFGGEADGQSPHKSVEKHTFSIKILPF